MQVRLLLGCAGSGKTFRCLNEARQALCAAPEGEPLILVAPKQGTYQLEQRLLSNSDLAGYTRLSILSFESLARFVFDKLNQPCPGVLSADGRVMVLRALLAQKRERLKVFRASARLTGFAQQLSRVMTELQRAQLSPVTLRQLAGDSPQAESLALKLHDLATLLEEYQNWLISHQLQDDDALLMLAARLLRQKAHPAFHVEALWVDGFAEFSALELDLLCALMPCCDRATLTFCLDAAPTQKTSWLSHWSMVSRSFEACKKHFAAVANAEVVTETLPREAVDRRLSKNPVLQHLEASWDSGRPYQAAAALANLSESLRLVACANREAEVMVAAREIRALVREGGRYRDACVVLRKLEPYYQLIQGVFPRYDIPFFLDRRESISHHPLAELIRSAVRLVAFGWQQEDWFAALKSGLAGVNDDEIDLLENEALARGWKGQVWHQPIVLRDLPKNDQDLARLKRLEVQLEIIRRRLVPPFERFTLALAALRNRPTGPELGAALRGLWDALQVERQLEVLVEGKPSGPAGLSVHETVWRQIGAWLDNAEMAFPREPLALREWLPILESGLANLTIGIIPPCLDQVLVGAVDRSRTPEVKLALVLGLNEGIFPAKPDHGSLLTENDRIELEQREVFLGSTTRRHLGRERYLGYIACTRAHQKLVLTRASQDAAGAPLIPSSLLSHLAQLFPSFPSETAPLQLRWEEAEHPAELVNCLLKMRRVEEGALLRTDAASELLSLPALSGLFRSMQHSTNPVGAERLAPEIAGRLYGPVLRTSVSRMEHFAACPFKFFVHSGLRAEERRLFELDIKEQGTFQHDVLALFHQQLRLEGKRWRDITPQQARELIATIARGLASSFREGLLDASEETRFTARVLTESLQDFVETLVGWMQHQYLFDPIEVELPFGEHDASPAWKLELTNGNQIELYGRIDRVDLFRPGNGERALCVVVDYKSSHKQLDPLLVSHGLQLQLLTYLNVVRQWPNPNEAFGVDSLEPAGVFYVNLRGRYGSERNRIDALADLDRARKLAYRHSGRFDTRALPQLDCRTDVQEGDQFNYRLTNNGKINKNCSEAVATAEFEGLLQEVGKNLRAMGQQIYAGRTEVEPYRIGAQTACEHCTYQAICRIDPWTHSFRVLRRESGSGVPRPTTISALP